MSGFKEAYLCSLSGETRTKLGPPIIIGRRKDCDVILNGKMASRRHARVSQKDGSVWIEDLHSSNGTFVNGDRVSPKHPLQLSSGDRVCFDIEVFVLNTDDELETEYRDADVQEVRAAHKVRPPWAWADPEGNVYADEHPGTIALSTKELDALCAAFKAHVEPLTNADLPYLQMTSGAKAGQTIKLKTGGNVNVWSIGSDSLRDIVLTDEGVSGYHAQIVNGGARWKVIDQMATNHLWVNERRTNISYLKDGDRVRIGPVEFIFRLPNDERILSESDVSSAWTNIGKWMLGGSALLLLVAAATYAAREWL